MVATPPTSTARPTPPSPGRTPTTRCGSPTSSSKPFATTATGSCVERTDGKVRKTLKARDLWRKVAEAAWACADPGVQFDTIINEWHTSPAGGRIRATNPCAEYMFLDNTACNLASINLVKFFDDDANVFDTEGYEHAIRLWTIILEISVAMAHFPSREIAQGSYDYRTLGLGYANLGTLLMREGLPYDSDAGRAVVRCHHRHPHRLLLRHLGRDGRRGRALPPLRREPGGDAAGDPQPPPGCLQRSERLRGVCPTS